MSRKRQKAQLTITILVLFAYDYFLCWTLLWVTPSPYLYYHTGDYRGAGEGCTRRNYYSRDQHNYIDHAIKTNLKYLYKLTRQSQKRGAMASSDATNCREEKTTMRNRAITSYTFGAYGSIDKPHNPIKLLLLPLGRTRHRTHPPKSLVPIRAKCTESVLSYLHGIPLICLSMFNTGSGDVELMSIKQRFSFRVPRTN